MHAVGDMADGHLLDGHAGPDALPHAPADLAVQFAHAVAGCRQAHGQDRHAEQLVLVIRVPSSQPQKIVAVESQRLVVVGEIAIHQVRTEVIVPRFHRGVGGEDQAWGRQFARLGK